MPLSKGSSKKVISSNIAELRRSAKRTGRIGSIKPESDEHARRIAVAIAMKKAGKSRRK